MKKHIAVCMLIAVLGMTVFSMITSAQDARGSGEAAGIPSGENLKAMIEWQDYSQGMARGKAQGKKVYLYFVADWCVYCKKMDADTFRNPQVASYLSSNFVPVKVDFDQQKDLVARYGVRGLPTSVFITENGEDISSLPGYIPPDQLLPMLKFVKTDSYQRMSFQTFMEKSGS